MHGVILVHTIWYFVHGSAAVQTKDGIHIMHMWYLYVCWRCEPGKDLTFDNAVLPYIFTWNLSSKYRELPRLRHKPQNTLYTRIEFWNISEYLSWTSTHDHDIRSTCHMIPVSYVCRVIQVNGSGAFCNNYLACYSVNRHRKGRRNAAKRKHRARTRIRHSELASWGRRKWFDDIYVRSIYIHLG